MSGCSLPRATRLGPGAPPTSCCWSWRSRSSRRSRSPRRDPDALDTAVVGLVKSLPGLVGWLWEISYDLLFVWALFVLGVSLFAHARKRLLFGELLAAALAYLFAMAAGGIAGIGVVRWAPRPRVLRPARRVSGDASRHRCRGHRGGVAPPVPPAAEHRQAGRRARRTREHRPRDRPADRRGRGLRRVLRRRSVVHLLLGSPGRQALAPTGRRGARRSRGRRDRPAVRAARNRAGSRWSWPRAADGGSLLVKIYGRDAWDGQLITSVWSSLWNRGQTPQFGGRLHQVEHEAFVTLFAERAGVPAMPVVAADMAEGRDAVLVVDTGDARPLVTLDPSQGRRCPAHAHLGTGCAARSTSGSPTAPWMGTGSRYGTDGTPAFGDFSQATVSAVGHGPARRIVRSSWCRPRSSSITGVPSRSRRR